MWEANERAEAEKAMQQKQQKAEDQQKAQESLQKEVCILVTPVKILTLPMLKVACTCSC